MAIVLRRMMIAVSAVLIGLVPLTIAPASAAPGVRLTSEQGAGSVISSTDITNRPNTRISGAGRVIAMTYLSENAEGKLIPVRGTVSIPARNPHGGPYRIFAWAHGTAGLGDGCTVTDRMGTVINGKGRWDGWMDIWLKQGYVITATEYAGIGGPGVHPYSDGQVQGKNVIDSVRAARAVVAQYSNTTASRGYVTSGGSQGGQSALWAGRLARTYAPELRNVGVSAQSVPVDIASMLRAVAPGVPPVAIPDYATYVAYVLAGVKAARPNIDVDSYLTPLGKRLVNEAKTRCYPEFSPETAKYSVGAMVSRPLAEGPLLGAVSELSKVPDVGYDAPILLQQGLLDPIAPAPLTAEWVDRARSHGAKIDYRTYQATHGLGAYSESASLKWANGLAWPGI